MIGFSSEIYPNLEIRTGVTADLIAQIIGPSSLSKYGPPLLLNRVSEKKQKMRIIFSVEIVIFAPKCETFYLRASHIIPKFSSALTGCREKHHPPNPSLHPAEKIGEKKRRIFSVEKKIGEKKL